VAYIDPQNAPDVGVAKEGEEGARGAPWWCTAAGTLPCGGELALLVRGVCRHVLMLVQESDCVPGFRVPKDLSCSPAALAMVHAMQVDRAGARGSCLQVSNRRRLQEALAV
jgi:hypothetical protein